LPTASKDGDALRLLTTIFNRLVSAREECFEFGGELMPSTFRTCGDGSHIVAFVGDETVGFGEPEGLGEQGVVANFRVAIKWQVCAVDREVTFYRGLYFLVFTACERNRRSPEETVVTDQEIDFCGDRLFKWDLTRINGSSDLGNQSEVLNLQAVISAREVFNFSLAGALITKRDNFREGRHV